METCATHGLRYDPNLHSGCTLCRRLENVSTQLAAAVAEEERPRWNNRVYGVVGVIVCGALLYWIWNGAVSGGTNMGAGWGSVCARRCAAHAESYSQQCGTRDSTSPCYSTTAGMLNDCLRGCGGPKLGQGELSLVYSTGDAPEWSQLVGPLTGAMKDVGSCRMGLFAARLSVMPNGKITRVGAGTPDTAAAECIELQFLQADITLPKGEYTLAVRGLPAPPPERTPNTLTPSKRDEPVAEKPKAIDYLAQVNKLAAQGGAVNAADAPAAPSDITPVPPLPAEWKPRVLPVYDVASEVRSGRGHPVAVIEYDAQCGPCGSVLDGLRSTVAQVRDRVQFRFYAVMLDSEQEQFVRYARDYQGVFEPVRISSPRPKAGLITAQMASLGVHSYHVVPSFALFNAAGTVVLQGADRMYLPELQAAILRLAREPNMGPLPDLAPPPDDFGDEQLGVADHDWHRLERVGEGGDVVHYPEPPELPGREPAAEPEPEPQPDDGYGQPEPSGEAQGQGFDGEQPQP
jgi:hypothetical protein